MTTCSTIAAAYTPVGAKPLAQSKPHLRLILPLGAGSGLDSIARAALPFLNQELADQSVIIDNIPGASGILGAAALARSPADGQTLGMVSSNHVINTNFHAKLPYDTLADFTPISIMGSVPFIWVVNPVKLPASTPSALLALLRAKPDHYTYASPGIGTVSHVAGLMLAQQAQIQMRHIPYKEPAIMMAELLSGQVDMGFFSIPTVLAHLKTGTLRAIGLCGTSRTTAMPELLPLAQQGLPHYAIEAWFSVLAPAKLPAQQIKRLYTAFVNAYRNPEVLAVMAKHGTVLHPSTPEAATIFLREEMKKYAQVLK